MGIPHVDERYDVCAWGGERHRTVTQVRLPPLVRGASNVTCVQHLRGSTVAKRHRFNFLSRKAKNLLV